MRERRPTLPLHVIKIGGSLLPKPSNRSAMDNATKWLAQQSGSINIVIVGGGQAVDHLRRWQRQFGITEKQSHFNAIQAMSRNTTRLAQCSYITSVIEDWGLLTSFVNRNSANPTTVLFDCLSFIRDVEPILTGTTLEASWNCTSDSIAARIAQLLHADKLILIKSKAASSGDLPTLQYANYVDRDFPQMAADIKSVTFVNCGS